MGESKHTIPVNGKADAAEEQSSAARAPEAGEQPQVKAPGAAAPEDADARPAAAPAGAAGGDGAAADLQGDLDELGKLAAKRDEYLALAQRTQADFENYRKRVARESALAKERGVA